MMSVRLATVRSRPVLLSGVLCFQGDIANGNGLNERSIEYWDYASWPRLNEDHDEVHSCHF